MFKKIIIFISLIIIFTVTLFVNADTDTIQKDEYNVDVVNKIELTDYYGISSLLINLHLDLGKVSGEKSIFDVVDLLSKMKYFSDLNIITFLSYTFDVQYSLDSLLFELSEILDKSENIRIEIEDNMINLNQNKENCDELKKLVDKNFSLALEDLDSKNMEINFNKSLDHEKCIWESRIYYNAQDKLLRKVDFYYEILKSKYTYFNNNRDDIIFNYPQILYNLSKK